MLQVTDRLPLEIKVSHGTEIGAWAGASRFNSRSIFDLIGGGAYGTGALGTFFSDIFGSAGVTYDYRGTGTEGRLKVAAYGYRVPVASSHYEVKAGSGWTTAGFSGVFWIDTDSLDLTRLFVDANELPAETGGCEAATTVAYQKVPVGDGVFLLPLRSSMLTVTTDASETRTAAAYSGCREYHGEATIRFDDAALSGKVQPAVVPTAPLPAGLPLSLVLTSPIDTDTAAAGDIVAAKLRRPLRMSKKILAPAGTKVEGRIVQTQHWLAKPRHFTISLMLEQLEVRGAAAPLHARLSRKPGSKRIHLPPARQSPAAATFVFMTNKSRYIVPRGYRSNWVTVEPPLEETR